MHNLLGAEAAELLRCLQQEPVVGLRVNTLKTPAANFRALAPWQLRDVPWCQDGFRLEAQANSPRPGLYPLHAAGVYYLQEPSAMAVVEALNPQPGERVIDLAAAPGGKSTHILSKLQHQGVLVANELTASRVKALGENLERWGARNAVITSETVAKLAHIWPARFDRVLLDAPCSGEGMFRKSQEAQAMWSTTSIAACASRQKDLLQDAAKLVKPGGVLVYSTCTFAPEENEGVIADFLSHHDAWKLAPLTLPGTEQGRPAWSGCSTWSNSRHPLERSVRLWPHKVAGEGHFVAKLRLSAGNGAAAPLKKPRFTPAPKEALRQWEAFVAQALAHDPCENAALSVQGDRLYAVTPDTLAFTSGALKTLRSGLWLGTLKKNRFEPSHALALALGATDAAQLALELEDARLLAYLRGEVIEDAAARGGWLLLCAAGFPLGWGKASAGNIKNFYPKGLRRVS